MDFDILINAMVNGIFVGIGVTTGNYIVNRALIKNIEKIEKRLNSVEAK